MRRIFIVIFMVFVLIANLNAQDDNDFPVPDLNSITGLKINQQKYYDGTALWGHINGGADLYLEYGFDKLLFLELEKDNVKYRVEFYRMTDAAAGFGVFSVSHFRCTNKDTLTKFICVSKYQLQSALGRFYISIANDKGTPDAGKFSINLFEMILSKCEDETFKLPVKLEPYSHHVKFFRGGIGIQNGFPLWSDMFENFSGFEITLFPYEIDKGFLNYSFIEFPSADERIKFMRSIGVHETKTESRFINSANGTNYIVELISQNEIYFYETVFDWEEVIEILVRN